MNARFRSIVQDPWIFSGLLFVVTVLLHSGTLMNGFSLDDYAAIVENPHVISTGEEGETRSVFASNFWGDRKRFEHVTTWRPLTTLTFRMVHSLAGMQPWAFHAASLVLHGLVTSLVFWLAFRWFGHFSVGVVAGVFFAVMPVHVEVIAGAVNCAELQAAALYLFATLLYLAGARSKKKRRFWGLLGSLLFFALALLSKEHAVTWPVALVIIEGTRRLRFRQRPNQEPWVRLPPVWFMAAVVLIIGIYLWSRSAVLPALLGGDIPISDNPMVQASVLERVLTIGKLYFRYLGLLIAPGVLTADYTTPVIEVATTIADADVFAGLVLLGLTLALVVVAIRRVPDVAGALLLFLMMASLVSNVFFLNTIVMAERLMYLPSVAWCCFIGVVVARVWDTARWHRVGRLILPLVMVFITVLYGWRSWDRVPEWKNNWTLFQAAVRDEPTSARSHYIYAAECWDRGRTDEARSHVVESIRLNPAAPASHELLGDIYWARRDAHAAHAAYEASFAVQSNSSALVKLCRASVQLGEVQRAVRPCSLAARAQPENAMAHHFHGLALMHTGQLIAGLTAMNTALKLEPQNPHILGDIARVKRAIKAGSEPASP